MCRANVRLVQREPSNITPKSYTYLKGYKDGKRLNVKKIYLGGEEVGWIVGYQGKSVSTMTYEKQLTVA